MAAAESLQDPEPLRSPEQARALVLDVLGDNADSLLGVARRHSLCLDDAQDAYQRALEIFLRHAHRLEADGARRWIHTVVKHEAMRLRAARQRQVPSDDVDYEAHAARHLPDAEERVLAFDRVTRSAEALQRLKPQELRALWLQAQGLSYQEIADRCDWTYTKVNRCITEGRRSFLARYAEIEAGQECARWQDTLSTLVDGEASAADVAALRPHLRNCGSCRATVRELHGSRRSIAAVLPLPLAGPAADEIPGVVGGLLGRAWELLMTQLHDRAVVSALKLQTAVEATSVGKLAAVTASAAALAGGGVAVDRVVAPPQRAAAAATTTKTAAAPAAARPRSPAPAGAPAPSAASVEFSLTDPQVGREFGVGDDGEAIGRSAAREFAPARRASEAPVAPARGEAAGLPTAVRADQAAAEFGP